MHCTSKWHRWCVQTAERTAAVWYIQQYSYAKSKGSERKGFGCTCGILVDDVDGSRSWNKLRTREHQYATKYEWVSMRFAIFLGMMSTPIYYYYYYCCNARKCVKQSTTNRFGWSPLNIRYDVHTSPTYYLLYTSTLENNYINNYLRSTLLW